LGRRRPTGNSRAVGPRAPLHHTEVHAGFAHRPHGGVRQGASQSMIAGFRREIRPMLRLATPLALAELGWMTMGFVDVIMAGRIGPAAMGAGGVGGMIFFPIVI